MYQLLLLLDDSYSAVTVPTEKETSPPATYVWRRACSAVLCPPPLGAPGALATTLAQGGSFPPVDRSRLIRLSPREAIRTDGAGWLRLVEPRDQMSSAHAALPTALLDKMQKILIFELTATNLRGTLRQLTRKELLEEARAASLPEAVRAGGAAAARDLLLLKARDVRKVDPVLGGRIEPVILVRTGVILVSLGRTELRALILHDRLYFMVPDGADSVLTAVQQNLMQLRAAQAG